MCRNYYLIELQERKKIWKTNFIVILTERNKTVPHTNYKSLIVTAFIHYSLKTSYISCNCVNTSFVVFASQQEDGLSDIKNDNWRSVCPDVYMLLGRD